MASENEWCSSAASANAVYADLDTNLTSKSRFRTFTRAMGGSHASPQEIAHRIVEEAGRDMALALELKAILDDFTQYISSHRDTTLVSPADDRTINIKSPANPEAFKITHLATGNELWVPGACLSFVETYRPNYSTEIVYGRMDPIATYGTTSRNITFDWEVDTNGGSDAYALAAVSDVIKFMYPLYDGDSLRGAPTLRIKFLNLLNKRYGDGQGLIVIVNDFTITGVDGTSQGMNAVLRRGKLIPQSYQLTMGLTVMHEENVVGFTMGGNPDEKFGQGKSFPYGYGSTIGGAEMAAAAQISRALEAAGLAATAAATASKEARRRLDAREREKTDADQRAKKRTENKGLRGWAAGGGSGREHTGPLER